MNAEEQKFHTIGRDYKKRIAAQGLKMWDTCCPKEKAKYEKLVAEASAHVAKWRVRRAQLLTPPAKP